MIKCVEKGAMVTQEEVAGKIFFTFEIDNQKLKFSKLFAFSVPRPEQLLSCKTLEIMWPGQADKESVDYVKNEATLSQLIADQDFLDLLRKMLRYSPVDRISSREALSHPFLRKYIC